MLCFRRFCEAWPTERSEATAQWRGIICAANDREPRVSCWRWRRGNGSVLGKVAYAPRWGVGVCGEENRGAKTMDVHMWLAFVSATFILSVVPGPSVLVVTGQAVTHGLKSALICISGELLGGVCLMFVSLLGVGAALAASPLAFLALKGFGVAFLVYIGLKALWAAINPTEQASAGSGAGGSFKAGFFTAVLNPKSLVFYLAFLTQFVDVTRPLPLQYAALILTAACVAGLVLSGYALLAAQLRRRISSGGAQRRVMGVSGVLYIAGGAYVAVAR